MGHSKEQDGLFGKYTEHFDDTGNKVGESKRHEGFFGPYVEQTDGAGNKIGKAQNREGLFGSHTQYVDNAGREIGHSRRQEGLFGPYTEHSDAEGNVIGESRQREGLFGSYTEHQGRTPYAGSASNDEASGLDWGGVLGAGIAILFGVTLLLVSWFLWLGMLLITLVVSVVYANSLAGGKDWATSLTYRFGDNAVAIGPLLSIVCAFLFLLAAGGFSGGTFNTLLLIIVVGVAAYASWFLAKRVVNWRLKTVTSSDG